MSSQAYVGLSHRTFEQALIHLLENDYGLLGSRRVLDLLVKDVQQLVDQFYPQPDRLSSGWLLFTGTQANGHKAYPGDQTSDYEVVTLAWPVLRRQDRQQLARQPETKPVRQQWFQQRLIRLIEYGWHHPDGPVLLTGADLAAMLGLTTVQVSLLQRRIPVEQMARLIEMQPSVVDAYVKLMSQYHPDLTSVTKSCVKT